MKRPLFFFFLLIVLNAKAQSLVIKTTRFVGSNTGCWVNNRHSIGTKDGGVLFVGETNCFMGGGDIPPSPWDTSVESDKANALVGKLDSNMQVSWVKIYGGSWLDYAIGAVQTGDGGYAILITTYSNNRDVSGNHGEGDLWLVRLNSTGDLLWQKCYGSYADEHGVSIATTPDNGFVILGVSNGMGDDVPAHYSGSVFDYDWFVVKTDSMGTRQWAKSIGGLDDENPYGSILSVGDNYYLVSSSASTDHDCTDTLWHAAAYTGNDYYIFKLDSGGNILWGKSYGGGSGDVAYDAIWDDRDSSIVVNGIGGIDGYMVSGNHGSNDMWVIKVDRDGALKWQKCLGGTKLEQGTSIVASANGYIVFGKESPGNIGFDDPWLFALDINGNELANIQFGGTGDEWVSSVVPFNHGFVATGYTNSLSFSEGVNVGHFPGLTGDAFISYIDYWPLAAQIINRAGQFALYPDPAIAQVNLVVPGKGDISIFNNIGKLAFQSSNIPNNRHLSVEVINWPNGIYIVKWRGEDGRVLINKFIKN